CRAQRELGQTRAVHRGGAPDRDPRFTREEGEGPLTVGGWAVGRRARQARDPWLLRGRQRWRRIRYYGARRDDGQHLERDVRRVDGERAVRSSRNQSRQEHRDPEAARDRRGGVDVLAHRGARGLEWRGRRERRQLEGLAPRRGTALRSDVSHP